MISAQLWNLRPWDSELLEEFFCWENGCPMRISRKNVVSPFRCLKQRLASWIGLQSLFAWMEFRMSLERLSCSETVMSCVNVKMIYLVCSQRFGLRLWLYKPFIALSSRANDIFKYVWMLQRWRIFLPGGSQLFHASYILIGKKTDGKSEIEFSSSRSARDRSNQFTIAPLAPG